MPVLLGVFEDLSSPTMSTPSPSEIVPGKYQMTDSENFDAFMGRLGVGYVTRKFGNASKPVVTITELEPMKRFDMKQESLVKTCNITFNLGQQFDELTADGRKCLSTLYMEKPNVMVHQMLGTDGGKDSVCWRAFAKEGLKVTCTVEDITTIRNYKRV
jgi:hypothetical protein